MKELRFLFTWLPVHSLLLLQQISAKIYVMNFAFSDEDLDNPQKCVEVTVDVMSWDVVPVTPEF